MDWGGAPDILRTLVDNLAPDTFEVTVVTGRTQSPAEKTRAFFKKQEGRLVVIGDLRRDIHPWHDLCAAVRLYALFRRLRPDIVHTHTAKAGFLGRCAARLTGVPVVVHTPHGHNLYGYGGQEISWCLRKVEQWAARYTDAYIALTELEKDDLLRYRVSSAEKIQVISQGIETGSCVPETQDHEAYRKACGFGPGDRIVGMTGRLEPVKGPRYFIEAAAQVAKGNPGVKFLLAGEGSLRKALEDDIVRAGLTGRCALLGWQEDMDRIFSILDILVLPSLNEAVGMVLIEAQSRGVPVVATKVGGVPEVVKDNETGVLVPPGDPLALARAIEGLLSDDTKRKRMGEAGRAWMQGRFKKEEMLRRTEELYLRLINSIAF